jgi:hypothetical protein
MSSHKLILTGLAATLLASAAQAGLVVRSVGTGVASFPVGRTVMPGTPINLAAGDMLTILEGQTTRTFRGPGSFDLGTAAQATTTLASATTALSSQAAARKPRLGTVRGIPPVDSPSLWDIELDTDATGNQCVADPATTLLRRTDTSTARTLTLQPEKGKPTTLTFAAGTPTAKWPKSLPIPGRYTLTDGSTTRTLVLARVPTPSGNPTADAEALITLNCTRQLERFVASLEK